MEDEIDPLDAYMASLELPSASLAATLAGAPASPVLSAIDWSTARRRLDGASSANARDGIDKDDDTHGAFTTISSSAVVKNRRYRRLHQLLQGEKVVQDLSQPGAMEANPDDWYFSDAMMQQRNPALFHFHVGQYLPGSAEAAAKAAASSDAQQANSDNSSSNSDAELLLSSFLLSTNDRREMETRRALEQRSWGKFTGQDEKDARAREKALFQQDAEEEDESSSDEDNDDEEEMKQSESQEQDAMDIAERRQLLVDLMIQRFLQGSDHEYVDYAVIDSNAALDDLEQIQRDAEDAYFDMDE
ncbi:hypothetical protein Gpo141_00000626 [Globisporangium polare]